MKEDDYIKTALDNMNGENLFLFEKVVVWSVIFAIFFLMVEL